MKNKLIAFFLFIVAHANAQNKICKAVDDIASMEKNIAQKKLQKNNLTAALASPNFTVGYYRCEWKVDPAVNFITGKVTSYFTITAATTNIVFDLYNGLIVDSVVIRRKKLSFSQSANETLTIQFSKIYKTNKKDSVSVYYHGVPAGSGFGSFVQTVHGALSSTPVIWTLSEPYGARDWWPCRNGLDDKADSIDIYVTYPSQYSASSNGLLVGITKNGSNATAHYQHRYPIASYLVAFSVTNFSTFTDFVQLGSASLPVYSYIYPEDSATFHSNTQYMLNAMQLYNEKFTPYPFMNERYGQTEFAWGGGMEHQTNSFITYPGQNLMAHELAHQWFGDKVTCGSWVDVWLNEGFATYCADFLYAEQFDKPTYKQNIKLDLAYVVSLPDGSVKVDDTTDIGRIFDGRLSYDKGAYLLRMLRWTVGDSVFFKALRDYLDDPLLKYNFARTTDLQKHFEDASGMNLDYFFNQWYSGQGYPSFTVQWSQDALNKATITISQVTSHPSVNFFQVPLALQFRKGSKTKTIVVQHTFNSQTVTADIGFAADTVLIDPDSYLISKNNKSVHVSSSKNAIPITVTPNPCTDHFQFALKEIAGQKLTIQLFDNFSHIIVNKTATATGALQQFNIAIPSTAHSGVYLLKITAGDHISTAHIIKQ